MPGGVIAFGECLIALEVAVRVGDVGLVLALLGLSLLQRRPVGPRVDLGQQVAFLDHLPLGESDPCDLAVDTAAHQHGVARLDGAEPGQHDGEVALLGRDGGDRHGGGRGGLLPRPRSFRFQPGIDHGAKAVAGAVGGVARACRKEQGPKQHSQPPRPGTASLIGHRTRLMDRRGAGGTRRCSRMADRYPGKPGYMSRL